MRHNIFLGVLLGLIATVFYSSQVAFIKAQANPLPLSMLIFVQSLVALACMAPVIFRHGLPGAKKLFATQKIGLHVLRAFAGLGISFFLFSAVKYIPLVNAVLLANTSPLMVPFISLVFLGQTINHKLWIPILIGFIGVTIILNPHGDIFNVAALFALGAAFCIAISIITVRFLSKTDSIESIVVYFFVLSAIIAALAAIPFWVSLSWQQWAFMIFIGLLYFGCQYALNYGLRYASAQLMSVMLYCNVIFSAIISIVFFHQVLTPMVAVGIVLTILGGVLCVRVEHLARNQVSVVNLSEGNHYDKAK